MPLSDLDGSLRQRFEAAVHAVQNSTSNSQTSNNTRLQFYALYKQATTGPCTGPRPAAYQIVERTKYDAWKKLGNMTSKEAAEAYVQVAEPVVQMAAKSAPTLTVPASADQDSSSKTSSPSGGDSGVMESKSVFSKDAFSDKVVFITGGATGICYGITRVFLAHGAKCVIASRSEENLKKACATLAAEVPGSAARIAYRVMDVREKDTIETCVKGIVQSYGRIDVLINGAAGNFLVPASKISPRAFRTVLEIDTVGTFLVSQAVFNHAFEKQKSGAILNISMTLHYTGMPMQVHAGAAKSAIDAMTRHLAVEWGKLANVRVNSVAPGAIQDTEGFKRLLPGNVRSELQRLTPLGRFGSTNDVAHACMFLCSDAATFVTGTTLVVDGGAWFTTGGISMSYL